MLMAMLTRGSSGAAALLSATAWGQRGYGNETAGSVRRVPQVQGTQGSHMHATEVARGQSMHARMHCRGKKS